MSTPSLVAIRDDPLQDYAYGVTVLSVSSEEWPVARERGDLLQGTLGMLILKALIAQDLHGYGIARWIEDVAKESLVIEEGSLYPALRRIEDRGWVRSRWEMSETNRRVRVYSLTKTGRAQLDAQASNWLGFARAVTRVLRAEPSLA